VAGEKALRLERIFCSNTGTYLGKSNLIRQVYHSMLAQAGLPRIRFHDLRQTACSVLVAAGVSIIVASGRGGDLTATPQFRGTTSALQTRKKKP
jgi:integrase